MIIILITIYILSIIGARYTYRLCSSKHYNLWLDEDCKFSLIWILPIFNTISIILIFGFIFIHIDRIFKLPKSKFFNTDL